MSNTDWLKNVQQVPITAAHAEGRSPTGAALAAIADAMQAEDAETFSAGDVMGVMVVRDAGLQCSVAVSTGDVSADRERLAQLHGTDVDKVALVPAANMLNQQFGGAGACMALPAAPVDVVDNRVTIDMLEYLLQKAKADGVPGSTVVALRGVDNNARGGVANFEVRPHMSAVAKTEFEKNWAIAKFVSRGGVPVLLLG